MLETLKRAFNRPEQMEYKPIQFKDNVEVAHVGRGRKPYQKKQQTLNDMLGVLKSAEGQSVTTHQLSDLMGYKYDSGINRILHELIERGAITRHGKKGQYTYKVKRLTVRRRRSTANVETRAVKPKKQVRRKSNVASEKPLPKSYRTVLMWLKNHELTPYTEREIADHVSLSPGGVNIAVRALCKKGLLERSLPTQEGTVYRVVIETANTKQPLGRPKPETVEQTEAMRKNEDNLLSVIEALSWEYMREHWNTNMLQFLTWLKQSKFKK